MKYNLRKLESVTSITMGQAPHSSECNHDKRGVPFVKAGEFGEKYPDIREWTTKPLKLASNDDILICVVGATAGKLNLGIDAAIGRSVAAIRCKTEKVNHKYLYFFLRTWTIKLRNRSQGSAIGVITRSMLNEIDIPLPPIETQKKIAEALDKAQELIDKRKVQIEKLDELLRSLFANMFGELNSWQIEAFGNILVSIDSGWSPNCNDYQAIGDEWGVLKLSAVTGGRYRTNENKGLPMNINPRPKLEIQPGDLLFTRKNTKELVGSCAFVFLTRPKLMLPDTIFRFKTKDSINKLYIWALFNERNFKNVIQGLATGTAGSMPNISKERVKSLILPIPPLELQNKFAQIVEKTEQQKALLEKSLAEMENNFNSIMQKAFRGELFN